MYKEMKIFRLFDKHYGYHIHPEHGKYNVCAMFWIFGKSSFIYVA